MFGECEEIGTEATCVGYGVAMDDGNLVGMGLKAQLVEKDKIPMTEKDWKMDAVIVDGEVYRRQSES
jgi:5-formyltetrahydrofolate cyclo-ligase